MLFLVITHVLAFALGVLVVCVIIFFIEDDDERKTPRSFPELKMPLNKPSHDPRETSLKYH